MRPSAAAPLLAVVLAAGAGASAASGKEPPPLATGAGHEIIWSPRELAPSRGPRHALVTLDVYFGFGHAQSLAAAGAARRAFEHPTSREVREVLHVIGVGPPGADLAAEAMLEADEQGRVWALLDRFIDARATPSTQAELSRAAREVGIDAARFDEALATRRHRPEMERLERDARAGSHLPGELLVDGVRVSPYASDEALVSEMAEGRRRAQALLDAGVPPAQLYERLLESVPDGAPADAAPVAPKRFACDLVGAPARGPSLAPITLVMFSNLACGGCAQLALLVRRLRDAHPGQVREVWKAFVPPYIVGGPEAYAAELAAAAAAQDRFWELHDLTFHGRVVRARPSRGELDALAADAHLDTARVQREERAGQLRAAVERDQAEGRRVGLTHAPALMVNGILFTTLPTYERLEKLVKEELGRGVLDRLTAP